MLNLPLDANILYSIVFTTNNSSDYTWILFIVILVISGLILGVLLLSFSNNPNDWKHIQLTDEFMPDGRLNNFANSIKNSSEQENYWPIKNHIETLFFEKVRTIHGLTFEEMYDLKNRDPNKLTNLIQDKEISDWIFNIKEDEKKGFFDFITTNKEKEKQKNLLKINKILERMEAWGD